MSDGDLDVPRHGLKRFIASHASAIQWASLAIVAVCVVIVNRHLPLLRVVAAFESGIALLGLWGPLLYGLCYALAVVLLVPAWPLTVAAGAMFGLGIGVLTTSLASTTGAAGAFLVARHLARGTLARYLDEHPLLAAVDRAISESGWRIVALLRLSPAVPFNLQNYLYGLTGIRFWPYVITSWVAMLPGTLLYVYLGYAGRLGYEASLGTAAQSRTPAEWAMIAVGLLATLALTVYITHLARSAIRRYDALTPAKSPRGTAAIDLTPECRWPWQAIAMAVVALVCVALTAAVVRHPDVLERFLAPIAGPPVVTLRETYPSGGRGPRFDHSALDALLKSHVSSDGLVDYRRLKEDPHALDTYIGALEKAPFDAMPRNEKLAFLINAYNACTLRLVLDYFPISSIRAIPATKRWSDARWRIGGHRWSLDQIEHEQIRPKFREPRIHFALVCAARGCPPLRNEAYTGAQLEQQLDDQARIVHASQRWFRIAPDGGMVWLTRLYLWYRADFEQVAGSILGFASHYSAELERAVEAGQTPRVRWLGYDWSLNDDTH
jgi:uncharacterized membrane protein YdjX (TVP38/TMEM64 family)